MRFSKAQQERLNANSNVKKVYPTFIHYTEEFKDNAVFQYNMGKSAKEIFIDAGFILEDLSDNRNYPAKTLNQWVAAKNNISDFPPKIKFPDKNTEFLMAKIAYLEEENKMLKKLKGIEN